MLLVDISSLDHGANFESARIGLHLVGDETEKRGFSRAVGPNNAYYTTLR